MPSYLSSFLKRIKPSGSDDSKSRISLKEKSRKDSPHRRSISAGNLNNINFDGTIRSTAIVRSVSHVAELATRIKHDSFTSKFFLDKFEKKG
jgi:hypothetical protein